MRLVQLDIERLEPSSSHNSSYVLLLREIGGDRKLPIVIGPCNAGSIAIYLESNSNPERPLTHDVILEFKDKSESLFYVCEIGEVWFINPSYLHASHHEAEETRIAMLANFDYSEKVYESLTRLL